MLQRFFRPRWQHTDPSVRLRAVATLDPQQDHDTLMLLARGDASVEVRCAAVARLRDPQLLEDYAHQDSHTEVRAAALTRLQLALTGSVADGLSAENRLRFIGLTSMPAVLLHVALHGQEPALRLAALQRIQDEDALLTLALDASDVSLRIQAAERIHDDDRLRRLARDGRDKKVVRLARERLKTAQQAQQAREQQRQQWQEWLEHLRTHSQRQYDNLYEARLQQLKQRGENLLTQATSEEREQAQSLLQACQQRIDAHLEEQRHAEACVAAQREQAGAVDTLESTLSALDHHDDWPSANSLGAMLASQQRRWQEAIGVVAADNKLTQRYDSLNARWQALISHWQNWQTDHTSAWPADLPTPPALRVHTEAATPGAAAESTAEQNDLDRTLAVLTNALRRRQLRLANRLWHKLESSGEQLTGAQRARMERLAPDLAELRDWHAFAAEPKKLQLCEEMEALANKDMPARDKADTIQLLHDRWRELMSADQDTDQALWDRFRAASDAAWAPCKEHFAELDRERGLNLTRRQQLCQQLSQYLDNLDPDNVSDWAAVAEIRRTAPQEWKQYQPVRFTDARDISRQFSALLKRFDTLLDEVAARHHARLEALISAAEQLLNSDNPRDAADRCKQLQAQWQQVGWVPAPRRRKLYQRFRKHADAIFARLQADRAAMRLQYQQQNAALRAALQNLQQALDHAQDEQSVQALAALANEIAELPCPRREEKLLQQREQLVRQARERRQKWPQWQRWDAVRQRLMQLPEADESVPQQELAIAMEVAAGLESPPAAREQRMQWQLQHLSDAMKSQNQSAMQRCLALLDSSTWLDQGVSQRIRERLLAAWQTQEPAR